MGKELSRKECELEAKRIGFPICKAFSYSLCELQALQKTLSHQQEGFVVLFSNGLRVKFKGEAYIQMNRILNSMNIKTVWEAMEDGKINMGYMHSVPEEIKEEAESFKKVLEEQFQQILDQANNELSILPVRPTSENDKEAFKTIGLFMKENSSKFKYPVLVFPLVRGKNKEVLLKIKSLIEPKLG